MRHVHVVEQEFTALTQAAGWLDQSDRSRLCLLGTDRVRFLHGQVTNDINGLGELTGCYAALVNAKGKMESDLFAYRLTDEILLDFEPGLTAVVQARLEQYVIAEDVEIADVAPHFGLLTVQGPQATTVLTALDLPTPSEPLTVAYTEDEIYVVHQPRLGTVGFDLFIPIDAMDDWRERLTAHAPRCQMPAFEKARVLATIPRFGVDYTTDHLPPEGGLEARAISYAKGCYIGQEIIARIRTYGKVNKVLRGLTLEGAAAGGDRVLHEGNPVGTLSSVCHEPSAALAIIKRGACEPGTALSVDTKNGSVPAQVATQPFEKFQ